MKLAIVGCRWFNDYELLCITMEDIKINIKNEWSWRFINKIISGGAKGTDTLAERYAKEKGYNFREFPANWNKHGKQAGYLRNIQIVDNADFIIAFWDRESKGTKHTIDLAKRKGKPYHVIIINKEE
jgi:hypothetical protein